MVKKYFIMAALCLCVVVSCAPRIDSFAAEEQIPAPAGLVLDCISETVSGVSTGMEYSTNGTTWRAVPADPLSVASLIPPATASKEVELQIRVRPTGTQTSLSETITLTKRPPTPASTAAKYSGLTETISVDAAIAGQIEYRIGTAGPFATVIGTTIPAASETAAQSVQIRIMPTISSFASAIRTITIPARRPAPNSIYNGSTDRITGVSSTMEFSTDGTTWYDVPGAFIPRATVPSGFGTAAGDVWIRYRKTSNAPISWEKQVPVPGPPGPPPGGFDLNPFLEIITGVSTDMEYSTNGTTWKPVTGSTLYVTNMIPSASARSDVNLRIRTKALGGEAASDFAEIKLPRRPVAPAAKFNGLSNPESIAVTAVAGYKAEYREGGAGDYLPVADGIITVNVDASSAAQVYHVRTMAADTPAVSFASVTRSVKAPARRGAPYASYSTLTDRINGVTRAMEYSTDDGATWSPVTGTYLQRGAGGFGNAAGIVLIRTRATATLPYSNSRPVNVPEPPGAPPLNLVLNLTDETIEGVSSDMEYSTSGRSWKPITGTSLSITSEIPAPSARAGVTLQVRFKAITGKSAASQPASIEIPKRPAAPLSTDVKFEGFSESILVSDLMEYRLGATGPFTPVLPVPEPPGKIPVDVDKAGQSYQVRFKVTASAFASATRTVSVPVRRAMPGAIYIASMDKIANVSSSMEFSLDNGATWINVPGSSIPRSELGWAEVTVLVRIKAIASASCSYERSISVPASSAPEPEPEPVPTP